MQEIPFSNQNPRGLQTQLIASTFGSENIEGIIEHMSLRYDGLC